MDKSWQNALAEELQRPYFYALRAFVQKERLAEDAKVYPPNELVFSALEKTPYDKVKVVIMGQDPYHGPGQAHGLSFSVPHGIPQPPSLKNIFKELSSDLDIPAPNHGCLNSWAEQGVLLLNATLTVRQGEPMSHYGQGWEKFTDAIVAKLVEREDPLIFVLWGKSAQEKCKSAGLSDKKHSHTVLMASHPSPFSAHQGFFGCRHFSKINEWLREHHKSEINWRL